MCLGNSGRDPTTFMDFFTEKGEQREKWEQFPFNIYESDSMLWVGKRKQFPIALFHFVSCNPGIASLNKKKKSCNPGTS